MYSIFRNANGRNKCIVFSATPTGYNSRWDAINVGGCLLGRFFRKLTEFQPNFFSNIKKFPKLLLQFFSIFFSKKFFYENFFLQMFFWWKFCYRIFFGENLSFHKTVSAKIFFTIFSRISFEFDVCEIMYFAECFIRNFAYCEFFCFAILVYGKIIVNFFCDFFFSDERECQI